jgi:hypothetical protein
MMMMNYITEYAFSLNKEATDKDDQNTHSSPVICGGTVRIFPE